MKKWIVAAIGALALQGCAAPAYAPRDIAAETDVCEVCNMSIVHEDYAGQIALANGDYTMFDDIGCLMQAESELSEGEEGAAFIKAADTGGWVDVQTAAYVYDASVWTPMSYGVLAFSTERAARDRIAKEGAGKLLTYRDLQSWRWGIPQ